MIDVKKDFKILSFNIHKGVDFFGKSQLTKLKDSLAVSDTDLVLLQELVGQHSFKQKNRHKIHTEDQLEFLADTIWSYMAYGKNAVYSDRHHGNAILSKHPVDWWENHDISETPFESRGVLMTRLPLSDKRYLWIANTHLSLIDKDRKVQMGRIFKLLSAIPASDPLILAGDFNDWNMGLSKLIGQSQLGLSEAYENLNGQLAKTFPAPWPILSLDRVYYRGIKPLDVQVQNSNLWKKLSDHLSMRVTFSF